MYKVFQTSLAFCHFFVTIIYEDPATSHCEEEGTVPIVPLAKDAIFSFDLAANCSSTLDFPVRYASIKIFFRAMLCIAVIIKGM